MYLFGAGSAWFKPLTDANGSSIANPTPILIGGNAFQDFDITDSKDSKMLYGSLGYPVDTAQGKGKLEIGCKFGSINLQAINTMFRGQVVTTGLNAIYYDSGAGTAIPTSPYQITITPPSSGTFAEDLGVINVTTGVMMNRVASTPSAGQYSVNEGTGVYTFASADNVSGILVKINYRYTATSTTAQTATVLNKPMGPAPYGILYLLQYDTQLGGIWTRKYYKTLCHEFKRGSKQDDYSIAEVKFTAFQDSQGRLFDESFTNMLL